MKRLCLFAGYNRDGLISSYVVDYVKELKKYSDVYYLADGFLSPGQIELLRPYVKGAWVDNHGKYDFGSYSELAKNYVGWEEVDKYDELLLINDSCFCVNSLEPVFKKMDGMKNVDFWGLLATDENNLDGVYRLDEYLCIPQRKIPMFCIGSYFLGLRKKLFNSSLFREFLDGVSVLESRIDICMKYEMTLTKIVIGNGYKVNCFEDTVYRYSTMYMREAFNLLRNGFPLIKKRIFEDNIGGIRQLQAFVPYINKYAKNDLEKYVKEVLHIKRTEGCITSSVPQVSKNRWRIKNIIRYLSPPIVIDALKYLRAKKKRLFRFKVNPAPFSENGVDCSGQLRNGCFPEKLVYSRNMVVFFNEARNYISGGMLSINRFVEHSMIFEEEFEFDLVISGLPLDCSKIENDYFHFARKPVLFQDIVRECMPEKVVLNIPECLLPLFIDALTDEMQSWLFCVDDLSINILNQNDDLMPSQWYLEEARVVCNGRLSITAAHSRYCNLFKERIYGCPIHLLTPYLPDFYRVPYKNKENLIVFSPDEIELGYQYSREDVVDMLKNRFPQFSFITIRNMTLEQYKQTIAKAKYVITFGEGYDGYFIEPYLSDSVAFAVYNKRFFPFGFKDLPTIYSSWSDLMANLGNDIIEFEADPTRYAKVSNLVESEIRKHINDSKSDEDLRSYYQRFFPARKNLGLSDERRLGDQCDSSDKTVSA